MTTLARATVSVTERLQHMLHPVTSYAIVPLFALANAGVAEAGSLQEPGPDPSLSVSAWDCWWAFLGVSGAAWLAVRTNVGRLPDGVRWPHILGVGALAGIGYTVSLLIADLAFSSPVLVDAAKLGILAGSLAAACLGGAIQRPSRSYFGARLGLPSLSQKMSQNNTRCRWSECPLPPAGGRCRARSTGAI